MCPGFYGCVMLQYIQSTLNVMNVHRMQKFSLYKKNRLISASFTPSFNTLAILSPFLLSVVIPLTSPCDCNFYRT